MRRLGLLVHALITSWAAVLRYAGSVNAALREVESARERLAGIQDEALANTLQALGDLYVRTDRLKEGEGAYTPRHCPEGGALRWWRPDTVA
jgi:hypothetical protein